MNASQTRKSGSNLEAQIRSINLSDRERNTALQAACIAEVFVDAVLSIRDTFEKASQPVEPISEIEAQIRSLNLSQRERSSALRAASIADVIVNAVARIRGKRERTSPKLFVTPRLN